MIYKPINAAERWEKNVIRINELVKTEGAKYYLFLQPTMGLNGIQSNPKIGSRDYELYKSIGNDYLSELNTFYFDVKQRCKKLTFCIDISDIAPPLGNYYNDPRHHNSSGNKIIADKIFQLIENDIGANFPN
jgi:hypothetical protein